MTKTNYNISAKETTYNGCIFRSRLEAKWAAFFDLVGWEWVYEPFDLKGWSPDFLIKGTEDILVEVKPITEFHYETCKKIDKAYPSGRAMILGCTTNISGFTREGPKKKITKADGFCWFRSKWESQWYRQHGLFISHSKPDEKNMVYAWTVCELAICIKTNQWGLYSNYGVGIDQNDEHNDYCMFNTDIGDSCDITNNKEKKLWEKAGNKTRFTYKNT